MMLRLLFKCGKFRLDGITPDLRIRLSKNAHWSCLSATSYETVNLRAAAAFRSSGDESVEKIFNRAFQTHYDLPRLPPLPHLDPHQLEGLKWVLHRKRSYLAHAPGAGKTAQAILAACLKRPDPFDGGCALFIVPPSLTVNWEREIRKFTEWLGIWPAIGIVPSSADQDSMAWRADFIICPDSMLAKPWVYTGLKNRRLDFIAVDEASRFKDPFSERSIAFFGGSVRDEKRGDRAFSGLFQNARHVVFLDGSPMPNRPMELWAPTYALHPEAIDCMDQNDFGYRYCGAKPNERGQWEFLHSSHEAELRVKLQKDFMHVVPEDRLSHPERRRSLLFINQDVRSPEHRSWERRHLGGLNLDEMDEEASQGELARFRAELGERKVPWVAGYAGERLADKNESILLFAWHRNVVEGLAEKLSKWNPGVIMGGVGSQARESAMDHFQRGKKKLLILNIAAGGRGHNLQAADRVLFGEYSWTDELNKQCEKRASRRGNEKAFTRCEYAVVPGSLDERVLTSIFTKEKRVRRIIG